MGGYFIGGIADITTSPGILRIINRDGIMGYHGVPQMPIFAYKAIEDEISVVAETDALVDKYCNGKGHESTTPTSEVKARNKTNNLMYSWSQHPVSAQHRRRPLGRVY